MLQAAAAAAVKSNATFCWLNQLKGDFKKQPKNPFSQCFLYFLFFVFIFHSSCLSMSSLTLFLFPSPIYLFLSLHPICRVVCVLHFALVSSYTSFTPTSSSSSSSFTLFMCLCTLSIHSYLFLCVFLCVSTV